MTQLWLPNVDHYEPSFEDYKVSTFICFVFVGNESIMAIVY
jgi:hypothetical protein